MDNYDEPESRLNGKITYNGLPVGVKGSNEAVQLQLWQDGFGLKTPIPVYVGQDGTFSAQLFNGTYKLVARDNNGPWENRHDTVEIIVSGSTQVDYPVVPYYTITDEQYVMEGNILKASFTVTKVGESKGIELVSLMVNKTTFVDLTSNVKQVSSNGNTGKVELSLDLSDINEKAIFARVGLKILEVGEPIYSAEVKKLK